MLTALEEKASKARYRYINALRLNKDMDLIFKLEDKYKALEVLAAEDKK
tara:strand:- start:570 stop:716 length:147 start_codon:yes stop_codon:yes gene_type:complete